VLAGLCGEKRHDDDDKLEVRDDILGFEQWVSGEFQSGL
jgi:hypothetical protein